MNDIQASRHVAQVHPDSYFQCAQEQRSARNTAFMFLLPGIGLVIGGIGVSRRKS